MNKLTVLAEMSLKDQLVKKLAELGVCHFHLLECRGAAAVNDEASNGEAQKLLLEVVVDSFKIESILKGFRGEDGTAVPSSIAVSDVFVRSTHDEEKDKKNSAPLHTRWIEDLITI